MKFSHLDKHRPSAVKILINDFKFIYNCGIISYKDIVIAFIMGCSNGKDL